MTKLPDLVKRPGISPVHQARRARCNPAVYQHSSQSRDRPSKHRQGAADSGAERRVRWSRPEPSEIPRSSPAPPESDGHACPGIPAPRPTFHSRGRPVNARAQRFERSLADRRPIHQRNHGPIAAIIQNRMQTHLQGTELSPFGRWIPHQNCARGVDKRSQAGFVLAGHHNHDVVERAERLDGRGQKGLSRKPKWSRGGPAARAAGPYRFPCASTRPPPESRHIDWVHGSWGEDSRKEGRLLIFDG